MARLGRSFPARPHLPRMLEAVGGATTSPDPVAAALAAVAPALALAHSPAAVAAILSAVAPSLTAANSLAATSAALSVVTQSSSADAGVSAASAASAAGALASSVSLSTDPAESSIASTDTQTALSFLVDPVVIQGDVPGVSTSAPASTAPDPVVATSSVVVPDTSILHQVDSISVLSAPSALGSGLVQSVDSTAVAAYVTDQVSSLGVSLDEPLMLISSSEVVLAFDYPLNAVGLPSSVQLLESMLALATDTILLSLAAPAVQPVFGMPGASGSLALGAVGILSSLQATPSPAIGDLAVVNVFVASAVFDDNLADSRKLLVKRRETSWIDLRGAPGQESEDELLKYADESIVYVFNYTPSLPGDEEILSIDVDTVSPAGDSSLDVLSASVAEKYVTVRLAGGTAGHRYTLKFLAETSFDNARAGRGRLKILE